MHWSEKIARDIIKEKPNKEEYVVAAGISPSGSVHIGNFRDIATSYFVALSLKKLGKKVKFLFSWDEYDRFRKVPKNVEAISKDFSKYIGLPYSDIPDPFGCHSSYAEHFEREFESSLAKFGITVDFKYQAKEYKSGNYANDIVYTLQNRKKAYDIIMSFKTQKPTEEERNNYYPVSIYCTACGKDDTYITSLSDDCQTATYKCKCGHEGTINFLTDHHSKLVWKLDWPMRWRAEGVDFEPGGKDHAAVGGSYQVCSVIAKEIYNIQPPRFQAYEFIGIKGTAGKMSGSTGLNIIPSTLLQIYQPEVILWLYSKTEPTKAFDFCFDDEILRQYFEFDKALAAYYDGTCNDYTKEIMELTVIDDKKLQLVPMSHLVNFGSIVSWNMDMLEELFRRIGLNFKKEQFIERLDLAKYWLERCAPENIIKLVDDMNYDYYDTMSEENKKMIELLYQGLKANDFSLDDLNTFLYSIPVKVYGDMDDKTKKSYQSKFFTDTYNLLIGKSKGPRLYLFLFAIDKAQYLELLDFSKPRVIKEKVVIEQPIIEEIVEIKEADPVAPIKQEITIDTFDTIDLRVCKIVKVSEIKKSNNCLKLTLDDGIKERVIVSSIRNDYTMEQLEGKKIIVVANLKPQRFSGVTSEGMLVAATNNACGCKVIFVDDSVPVGTAIH